MAMSFLVKFGATLVISLVLVTAVIVAVVWMVKRNREGKSAGSYCQGCPNAAYCHRKTTTGCGRYRQPADATKSSETSDTGESR